MSKKKTKKQKDTAKLRIKPRKVVLATGDPTRAKKNKKDGGDGDKIRSAVVRLMQQGYVRSTKTVDAIVDGLRQGTLQLIVRTTPATRGTGRSTTTDGTGS
jgi:hypothetical protein